MNRLTSGMVPLFALLLVAGCSSDPTDDLRNGISQIGASPSQVVLQLGETQTVDVSAVDDQGNRITTAYEVTNPGTGISIRRDSTFLPIFIDDTTLSVPPEAPVFRYIVTADAYTTTSFTVSAGGVDVVVPVHVVAENVIEAEISDTTPDLNQVVTITAPAGITFSPTSTVTLADPTAVQPADIVVAGDGSSLTFLPPPNVTSAQLVISDVVSAGAPGVLFAPSTTARITTPGLTVFDGTVSNLAPALGEPIDITLTGATIDPATTTFAIGAAPATLVGATATTASIIPGPGSVGLIIINGVVVDTLPQFALSLTNPILDTVSVPSVALPIAGTDDINTAPAVAPPGDFPSVTFDSSSFTGADITGDGGVGAQYYKFTVAATDTITISSTSDTGGPDLDLIVCGDVACNTAPLVAASAAHDEIGTAEFLPGTYWIAVVNFDGGASNWINLTLAPGVIEP